MSEHKIAKHYSLFNLTKRLLKIAAPTKKRIVEATFASVIGNLSQMGLMGFGVLSLLCIAGKITAGPSGLYIALTIISAVLIAVCRYIEGATSHDGAYHLLSGMRVDLYRNIRRLAPACLIDMEKGDILNIAVSDIETIEFFFAHTIGPMFTVVLLPSITIILALIINPLFAAVLLPIYLIVSVIFPLIAVKIGRPIGEKYRVRLGKMKSIVLESIYGLKDIQIFGYGDRKLEDVRRKNKEVNAAAHGLTIHRQTVSAAPTFFIYLARILIIAVASYLAANGAPNPSGTIVLSFVSAASFSSTQSLTTVVSSLLETYAAAERLFKLEDRESEVEEVTHPKQMGKIREIDFDHVNFTYTDEKHTILNDFNLKITGTEKIGIMGESGVGKSTVLRLLLRFWEPTDGHIRINGIPLDQLSLTELHQRIAMLEQDTFLFSGSIAENIAVGKPDASLSEIKTAARRAGIDEFIQTLPDSYDTQMGQMQARLSGGEKQRIGIARTMLTSPDVLVMDEPTSSLDVLHEKELLKTLKEECGDMMIIIVSHRQSTLTDCDRTVHLKHNDLK